MPTESPMVESMSEGAATLLGDATVAYANARLAAMLRIPLEQLCSADRWRSTSVPPEAERFLAACVAARQGSKVEEVELRRTDGSVVPTRIALNPLPPSSQLNEAVPAALSGGDRSDRFAPATSSWRAAIKERVSAETSLRVGGSPEGRLSGDARARAQESAFSHSAMRVRC